MTIFLLLLLPPTRCTRLTLILRNPRLFILFVFPCNFRRNGALIWALDFNSFQDFWLPATKVVQSHLLSFFNHLLIAVSDIFIEQKPVFALLLKHTVCGFQQKWRNWIKHENATFLKDFPTPWAACYAILSIKSWAPKGTLKSRQKCSGNLIISTIGCKASICFFSAPLPIMSEVAQISSKVQQLPVSGSLECLSYSRTLSVKRHLCCSFYASILMAPIDMF